jgi:UDP-3-O-[3-hydroxymyristoyl] N-acetylglucosamine deacetylase
METKHMHTHSKYYQHTLRECISCIGVGLHSGLPVTMTVMPAEDNSGIIFHRRDLDPARAEVHARWNTVTDTRMSTTIANSSGTSVSSIEHLMAALYTCGIDNARVVLDAPEVPCMDGSSVTFVKLIKQTGVTTQTSLRRAIVITKAVSICEGEQRVSLTPSRTPTVAVNINCEQKNIGQQSYSCPINAQEFSRELASARTFFLQEQLHTMNKLGLARGGSLRNAVLIEDGEIQNKEGLRFDNEFARHQALDAIGDLGLAGAAIIGSFQGLLSGHKLNNALLHELMLNEDCWCYTSLQEAEENWSEIFEMANGLNISV